MPNKALLALSLVGWLLASAEVRANDNAAAAGSREPVSLDTRSQADSPSSWNVVFSNGEYGGRMSRIPPGTKVRKYRLDTQGQTQGLQAFSARAGTKVIYSNTNSIDPLPGGGRVGAVWSPGAGARVADDMTTQAISPCELTEIVIDVHGGNLDPNDVDPGAFGVTLQLWDGCPNGGGSLLTDSSGAPLPPFIFDGLLDNEISKLSIMLPPGTIPPSTTIWVSGIFDTGFVDNLHVGAGFIIGSPPEKGFSIDGADNPVFPCAGNFGGWPDALHASIAAQVLAVDTCETHFFAYLAENNSKETFDLGRNTRIAEDITLTVNDCELSTYEIGVIGQAHNFQLLADLRTGPISGPSAQPLSIIPGTEGVFLGRGLGEVEVAKFAFPPGIAIPQELWVTWSVNRRNTGAIMTQNTQIGTGSDLFAYEDPFIGKCTTSGDPCSSDDDCLSGEFCNFWTTEDFAGPKTAIFYVAVNCRGEAPTGACCRIPKEADPSTGVCADDVTAAGCPQGRWSRGDSCSPDPFNPACGTAACCFENSIGGSDCSNITKSECDLAGDCTASSCIDKPGVWQPGHFCGDDDFQCLWFACFFSVTDEFASCTEPHPPERECQRDADCRPEDGWYWGCDRPATCSGSGEQCDGACGTFDKVCSVSGLMCNDNSDCEIGETCVPCRPLDNDCPAGETCDPTFPALGICGFPAGCNNSRCCDTVCRSSTGEILACCEPGAGWAFQCTELAQNTCALPVTNDECFDPDSGQEADIISLHPDGAGGFEAVISVNTLGIATWNFIPGFEDPDICCSNAGVNESAAASEWFLVESLAGSMLVSTCDSDEQAGQDTILQVFKTGTPGTPAQQCDDLIPLACNDDAGCGTDGKMSAVCVNGIAVGEPAYIQLSTPGFNNADRRYKLTIKQPCPNGFGEPWYTRCLGAKDAPIGAAEVLFECPDFGPGIVCLQGTTMTCEGLDPNEACFTAMKNDVWINYTPSCTGILSINSCESPPLTSPDTTMAMYGAIVPSPNEEQKCPDGGALLLDCNDDADVNAEEHELRPQECTLGRNACLTDADCALPEESCIGNVCVTSCAGTGTCPLPGQVCAKACSVSGDACTTASDCPDGESCDFDECIRPCDADAGCTLAACSVGKNLCADDSDCKVGQCSWDFAECDMDQGCGRTCRMNKVPCVLTPTGSDCPLQPNGAEDSCIPQTCIRDEVCVGEICASECWPGSTMKLPVSQNRSYKIRLGGEFGSAPEGSLKFDCVPEDCDFDGVPNICNMDCSAMNGACQQWPFSCGTTQDCHSANKRCTVGGSYSLSGDPCVDDTDCPAGETCSSGFNTFDPRIDIPDNCDIGFGRSKDCDPIGPAAKNGIPDECEIRDDPSKDLNGNGILDECEDADICGDGTISGSELCDDGALNGTGEGFCLADCSAVQACGDGVVNGTEVCDGAGNAACDGRLCRRNCTCAPPTCGNGIRDGGEACDGADDALCRGGGCKLDCTCRLSKPKRPTSKDVARTRLRSDPKKSVR